MPVVDASVFVSVANEADRSHARCCAWMESCLLDGRPLVAPNLFLVEVAAAIRRLTGEQSVAQRVVSDLRETNVIELVPLTMERSRRAAELAMATAVRGADAVYLALARERDDTLVTLDRQQLQRGATVARIERP